MGPVAEITYWRPSNDHLQLLQEGRCFYATHLSVRKLATHLDRAHALTSTKSTSFMLKKRQDPYGRLHFGPRSPVRVQQLSAHALYTPFDMVAVVVYVAPLFLIA